MPHFCVWQLQCNALGLSVCFVTPVHSHQFNQQSKQQLDGKCPLWPSGSIKHAMHTEAHMLAADNQVLSSSRHLSPHLSPPFIPPIPPYQNTAPLSYQEQCSFNNRSSLPHFTLNATRLLTPTVCGQVPAGVQSPTSNCCSILAETNITHVTFRARSGRKCSADTCQLK